MRDNLMLDIEQVPFVRVERIREDAFMPVKAHETDSGYDIRIPDGLHLRPNELKLVEMGIRLQIPPGYECQVRSRSGMPMKHGVMFVLGVGTIDQDYRGEVKVPLWNFGEKRVFLDRGTGVAQLVFQPVQKIRLKEASVSIDTERGEGGFGSTDDQVDVTD